MEQKSGCYYPFAIYFNYIGGQNIIVIDGIYNYFLAGNISYYFIEMDNLETQVLCSDNVDIANGTLINSVGDIDFSTSMLLDYEFRETLEHQHQWVSKLEYESAET